MAKMSEKAEYDPDERGRTAHTYQVVTTHLGGPWKPGMPDAKGVMDCPVCGGIETLHYKRSSLNGHLHFGCVAKGCVGFVE
jgi:hypothetical protein